MSEMTAEDTYMTFTGRVRLDGCGNPVPGPITVKEVHHCPMAAVCCEVKKMRERCAKLCEVEVRREAGYHGQWEGYGTWVGMGSKTGEECAADIRAMEVESCSRDANKVES